MPDLTPTGSPDTLPLTAPCLVCCRAEVAVNLNGTIRRHGRPTCRGSGAPLVSSEVVADALFRYMATALNQTAPALPEVRCMGRRCGRAAEFAVSTLDEEKGAHEHPVQLCRGCLCAMKPNGWPVDIFRWLTNNKTEADRA